MTEREGGETYRLSRVLTVFSGKGGSGAKGGDVLELLGDDEVDDGVQANTMISKVCTTWSILSWRERRAQLDCLGWSSSSVLELLA
jgi:hypothetical protein